MSNPMPQVFTRLVVDELITSISENVTLDSKMSLERAILGLYVRGNPVGSVKLEVYKGAELVTEVIIPISELIQKAEKTAEHYHGQVSFIFDSAPEISAGEYEFKLSGMDYSFSENHFIGWMRRQTRDTQTLPQNFPLDIRLTEFRRR